MGLQPRAILRHLRALISRLGCAATATSNEVASISHAVKQLADDVVTVLERQGVVQADSLLACVWCLLDATGWIYTASTSDAAARGAQEEAAAAGVWCHILRAAVVAHKACEQVQGSVPDLPSQCPERKVWMLAAANKLLQDHAGALPQQVPAGASAAAAAAAAASAAPPVPARAAQAADPFTTALATHTATAQWRKQASALLKAWCWQLASASSAQGVARVEEGKQQVLGWCQMPFLRLALQLQDTSVPMRVGTADCRWLVEGVSVAITALADVQGAADVSWLLDMGRQHTQQQQQHTLEHNEEQQDQGPPQQQQQQQQQGDRQWQHEHAAREADRAELAAILKEAQYLWWMGLHTACSYLWHLLSTFARDAWNNPLTKAAVPLLAEQVRRGQLLQALAGMGPNHSIAAGMQLALTCVTQLLRPCMHTEWLCQLGNIHQALGTHPAEYLSTDESPASSSSSSGPDSGGGATTTTTTSSSRSSSSSQMQAEDAYLVHLGASGRVWWPLLPCTQAGSSVPATTAPQSQGFLRQEPAGSTTAGEAGTRSASASSSSSRTGAAVQGGCVAGGVHVPGPSCAGGSRPPTAAAAAAAAAAAGAAGGGGPHGGQYSTPSRPRGSAAAAVLRVPIGTPPSAYPTGQVVWSQLVVTVQYIALFSELQDRQQVERGLILMGLLLQQAEPSLRAEFLSHPCGSLLLGYAAAAAKASLLTVDKPGYSPLVTDVRLLVRDGAAGLQAYREGGPHDGLVLSTVSIASAVLMWACAELCPPAPEHQRQHKQQQQQQQQQSAGGSVAQEGGSQQQQQQQQLEQGQHQHLPLLDQEAAAAGAVLVCVCDDLPGALPLAAVPAAHLRLVSGYTPSVQLLKTVNDLIAASWRPPFRSIWPISLLEVVLGPCVSAAVSASSRDVADSMWKTLGCLATSLARQEGYWPWRQSAVLHHMDQEFYFPGDDLPAADELLARPETQAQHLQLLVAPCRVLSGLVQAAITAVQQPGCGLPALQLAAAVQQMAGSCATAALRCVMSLVGEEPAQPPLGLVPFQPSSPPAPAAAQQAPPAAAAAAASSTPAGPEAAAAAAAAASSTPAEPAAQVLSVEDCAWLEALMQHLGTAYDLLQQLAAVKPRCCAPDGSTPGAQQPAVAGGSLCAAACSSGTKAAHQHSTAGQDAPGASSSSSSSSSSSGGGDINGRRASNSGHQRSGGGRCSDSSSTACLSAADGDPHVQELLMQVSSVAQHMMQVCPVRLMLLGCGNRECQCLDVAVGTGRPCVCGGCGCVHYCSEECQEADWPHHAHTCGRLRRARLGRSNGSNQQRSAQRA